MLEPAVGFADGTGRLSLALPPKSFRRLRLNRVSSFSPEPDGMVFINLVNRDEATFRRGFCHLAGFWLVA